MNAVPGVRSLNYLLFILIIPILGIGLFMFFKKRRQGKNGPGPAQPAQKDEVWQTLKRKLRDDGEVGKEIVDPYVQRRQGKEFKKRDVYVVLFSTRDSKTLELSPPRALEVEIRTTKLSRNNSDRKVIVNGYKDYATENEWIAKAREKEDKRSRKERARVEKRAAKSAERIKARKAAARAGTPRRIAGLPLPRRRAPKPGEQPRPT